jgi:hypothetical protein
MTTNSKFQRVESDFAEINGPYIVTANFQDVHRSPKVSIEISGYCNDDFPRLLLQLTMAVRVETEAKMIERLRDLLPVLTGAIPKQSETLGILAPLAPRRGQQSTLVALQHVRMLTDQLGMSPQPISLAAKTAQQFNLAKSFSVSNPVELIAQIEGVPVTTIRRRLAKARDGELIAKVRGEDNDKNS